MIPLQSSGRACQPFKSRWHPRLPVGWRMTRLKYELRINEGGVWGDEPNGIQDTVVLRSTDQTVDGRWAIHDPALRSLPKSVVDLNKLRVGDLVLTKSSGSELHIGKTSVVTEDVARLNVCCSNFMQRLRTRSMCPEFLFYYLNSVARVQFNYLASTTTGLANLNGSLIGDLEVPVPPQDEQRAIADFLDREIALIDELVAQKTRLASGLSKSLKEVLATCMAGLGPSIRLKFMLRRIDQGTSPQAEEREAEPNGWGVLKAGCVNGGEFRETEHKALPLGTPVEEAMEVGPGDVLMSRASGSAELVGSVAFVRACRPRLLLSDKTFRLVPDTRRLDPRFLSIALGSPVARAEIHRTCRKRARCVGWRGKAGSMDPLPGAGAVTTGATRPTIGEMFEDGQTVDRAIRRGVELALLDHEREGADVVVFHDNRVMWVTVKQARELAARDRDRR